MIQDRELPQESDLGQVELAVGHWLYWMQFADANSGTYQKVLVPLDMKEETERVLPQADRLLSYGGEGILLHVITAASITPAVGGAARFSGDQPDAVRSGAVEYLQGLVDRLGCGSGRWRCEVIREASVAEGVVTYAVREKVDLIAMYSGQRKGFAKLTRRSTAKTVQQRAPVEVRIFRSAERARSSPIRTLDQGRTVLPTLGLLEGGILG